MGSTGKVAESQEYFPYVTNYEAPELGTVATVREGIGIACELILTWGPEEVDRIEMWSPHAAQRLAREHAESFGGPVSDDEVGPSGGRA
jgi:hypothetical protein